MNDMDGFNFIFNSEGLFDFKDNDKKEETATVTKNEEVEILKHDLHVKNQIILKLLAQCDSYSGILAEIIKYANTIPDIDTKMNNKIDDISKTLDMHVKVHNLLKMAIEFEERMED